MLYLWLCLFAAGIVALDQIVKTWVVRTIALGAQAPGLPGLFHLTYVQNTGASFSMLAGGRWFFLAILMAFAVVLAVLIWKKKLTRPAELWCLFAILGGGLGNAIDRLFHGYVVDMIELDFMRFAVFNVADIFVTCGCLALIVLILFPKPKREAKNEA